MSITLEERISAMIENQLAFKWLQLCIQVVNLSKPMTNHWLLYHSRGFSEMHICSHNGLLWCCNTSAFCHQSRMITDECSHCGWRKILTIHIAAAMNDSFPFNDKSINSSDSEITKPRSSDPKNQAIINCDIPSKNISSSQTTDVIACTHRLICKAQSEEKWYREITWTQQHTGPILCL